MWYSSELGCPNKHDNLDKTLKWSLLRLKAEQSVKKGRTSVLYLAGCLLIRSHGDLDISTI